jgi:antitoxin component HigA of HigAB toxin-antitoxin module
MSHILDPEHLESHADYAAALGELEDLLLSDPDTPAGRRFDELVRLIEDFEARNWPAEVPPRADVHAPGASYAPRYRAA